MAAYSAGADLAGTEADTEDIALAHTVAVQAEHHSIAGTGIVDIEAAGRRHAIGRTGVPGPTAAIAARHCHPAGRSP